MYMNTQRPYTSLFQTHSIVSVKKPWGRSKVDGLISGCLRENAHRLDQRFYIIFLQPAHTSHSPTSDKNLLDRMWLTSFGSQVLNYSSVTLLLWPLHSFHCLYFFSPLQPTVHRNVHNVKIRFWLNSQLWCFFFTSNCDTFGELYYLFIGIFSAFTRHDEICVYKHTSIFQGASTHSRQKARSVGKRSTHWMLRECCRCLQSGPYSQRSLYSCISAFQDAGRLVHCWFDGLLCLLPEQVVYILTLVSTEPKRCCWIGYHPLLQVRIQTPARLCFFRGYILKAKL